MVMASRAARSMCSSRSRSDASPDSRRILHPAFAFDSGAKVVVDEAPGFEVDGAAEHLGQLGLHAAEIEQARGGTGEFDEDIDIAGGRKVVPKDRPKQRESSDAVTPAEGGDLIGVDVDAVIGHANAMIT